MTVICATDFSHPAAEALSVAAAIARKRNERLLIWHAVPPAGGDPVDLSVETTRDACATRLEIEAEPIRAAGVSVETEVVVGYADRALPARLPGDATLIVAGARGHRPASHWLIGTTVERLARVTTVPLLVVRNAAVLQNWLDGAAKLSVMMATDLTAISDHALRRAALLGQLGPCDVELLYVEYPPDEFVRLGVEAPVRVLQSHPAIDTVLNDELARRAGSIHMGGSVSTRIATGIGQTGGFIAREAAGTRADVVVVGAHQRDALSRLWHGSIAHGVLHSADTNVLLIPVHTSDEELRALDPVSVETIVAATDFSPCGNRAVAWACSVARPGTHVVILNVVRDERESDASALQLTRLKTTMARRDALKIDTVTTVSDDVGATICSTAERVSADVVIVGSHTRSRVKHLLLRSVSDDVVARSRRPVLVVPDPVTI